MKRTTVAVLALLAGCATSPAEVRESAGPIGPVYSPAPPERAAVCLQKYWEDQSGEITGGIVPLDHGGLDLRIRQGEFGTIAVYELRPNLRGAAVQMWWREHVVVGNTEDGLRGLLARCR